MSRNAEYLFHKYDLRQLLEHQRPEVKATVEKITEDRLLSTDPDELLAQLVEDAKIARLELRPEEVSVDTSEVQIDARSLPDRFIRDTSRPFWLPGTRISYYVPFSGDANLLLAQPSTYTMNPPRAIIEDGELVFVFERTDANLTETKPLFDRMVSEIQQWIGWVNQQVDAYNDGLPDFIKGELVGRRGRIDSARSQLQNLGLKVRQKSPPVAAPSSHSPPASPRSKSRSTSPVTHEFDVAFSFAGENRTYVERVAELVRAKGIAVYYDGFFEVQMWGQNLADHFAEVFTKRARYVVIFASKHYAAKAWPNYERQQVQSRAIKSKETVILPVRFDDTEIPGLDAVKHVDISTMPPEQLAELIEQKVRSVK